MAAPDAVDGSTIQPDNWGPQEDQEMGPGGNGQATAGASLPVDERSAGQEPENPEYPRGSSVSDNETFREKQVKVLRLFLSVLCLLVRSSFLGLALQCWACRFLELLPHSRPNLLLLCRRLVYSVLRTILLILPVLTGVYFLPCSRIKSTLVVFLNTLAKKTYKVVLGKLET